MAPHTTVILDMTLTFDFCRLRHLPRLTRVLFSPTTFILQSWLTIPLLLILILKMAYVGENYVFNYSVLNLSGTKKKSFIIVLQKLLDSFLIDNSHFRNKYPVSSWNYTNIHETPQRTSRFRTTTRG